MNEETLFAAALERTLPEDRQAFLDQSCGKDSDLRRQVEELLAAHDQAGQFLISPAVIRPAESAKPRQGSAANDGEVSLDFLEPLDEGSREGGSPQPPETADRPPLGKLGPYLITEVIGRGGMGVVLKGWDSKLHRVVAVKVMAADSGASVLARRRFLREARAAAAVSHDHVVTIHAIDEGGKLPYLVMEYVQGWSLQQRLERTGPLAVPEILRIARQTALGLAAAHEQGLIHRDVKPANILLENGVERVKLTDFGLARAVDDAGITQTGIVAGTPEYMSPEQAQGGPVDHRSDLFSLGCVMYAMCTGRSPFRADSAIAVIRRVCDDNPRPISQVNSEIPSWLIQTIDRLLQKQPEGRFTSAREVADHLAACLSHLHDPEQIPCPAVSLGTAETETGDRGSDSIVDALPASEPALPRFASRRRWPIAAAVAGVIFMSVLGLTEATGVTEISQTVIRVAMGEGTLVIEVDDPSVEVQIDGEDQVVVRGAGVSELRIRPGEYRVKAVKEGRPVQRQSVTMSRNGREVVRIGYQEDPPSTGTPPAEPVLKAEPRFEKLKTFAGAPGQPLEARFSPDGQTVLVLSDQRDQAEVFRRSDGERIAVLPGKFQAGAFTPDGQRIVTGDFQSDGQGQNALVVWEADTGKRLFALEKVTGAFQEIAISPDGRTVVSGHGQWWGDYQDRDQTIRVWDLEQRKLVHEITEHTEQVLSVAILPDGRHFVSGSRDQTVRLWDLETGKEVRQFAGTLTEAFAVAASPDGRLVLAGFGPDHQTGIQGQVIDDLEHCRGVIWDVESGAEVLRLEGHRGCIRSVAFSPDGRWIATASGGAHVGEPLPSGAAKSSLDMTVRLWDAGSGRQVAAIDHHSTAQRVEFSPEGDALLSSEWQAAHLWRMPEDLAAPRKLRELALALKRDGKTDIYLTDEMGTRWQNLTDHEADDLGPAFSPDGTQIAFCSHRSGNLDIWLMNADGSNLRQLTDYEGIDRTPAWSPDGTRLAFVRHLAPDQWNIFVMNADGSEQRSLLDQPGKAADPAWSPDGASIAYSFDSDGTRLFVMNADGTEPRMLAARRTMFAFPAWSPDGKSIVYTARTDEDEEALELFVVDRESGESRQMTSLGGLNTFAAWSPDGKRIAFQHRSPNFPGQQMKVYLIDAESTEPEELTGSEAPIGFGGGRPTWRPPGAMPAS